MPFSLVSSWKKDLPLNSYIFCLFLIGLPFTIFGNYVIYQLQVVGFLIGSDIDGQPCLEYCLMPFGTRKLDLNSVLLYLNAMGFALGGGLSLFISAYADYWNNKSHLVIFFIICYGAVAVPAYWLKGISLANFRALMALYVVYAVITYILSALMSIYIPHCMRSGADNALPSSPGRDELTNKESTMISESKTQGNEIYSLADESKTSKPPKNRKYGFKMSILGGVGTTIGGILALLLVIILSQTLSTADGQSAGLLITTVVGFTTLAGSTVAYFGLPVVPAKERGNWKSWWLELVMPFKDLLSRKNMLALLLSFTIYSDTSFALNSVTSQLYFTEVKPNALEFSLYTIAGNLFQFACTMGFFALQVWWPPFRLERWLIVGYGLILVIPIWGCIGLAGNIDFGFKNRWEFYIQSFVFNLSGAIVNPTFRVLFSELIPKGCEIEWFGLQVILSCATAWISYVTNAPLQNTTHQLRFPLILCLIFLVMPVVIEVLRTTLRVFEKDVLRWQDDNENKPTATDPKTLSHL